mgnify:CR=1 FL=1
MRLLFARQVMGRPFAAPPGVPEDRKQALVKARQKFFGIENVDDKGNVKKDKVIFSWSTNTTYVVSVKGRVLMLDDVVQTTVSRDIRELGLVKVRGRGGRLVYATCSSEPEENEAVVTAFLAQRPDYRLERTHQTLPFRDGLEAFYGAVLRREAAS